MHHLLPIQQKSRVSLKEAQWKEVPKRVPALQDARRRAKESLLTLQKRRVQDPGQFEPYRKRNWRANSQCSHQLRLPYIKHDLSAQNWSVRKVRTGGTSSEPHHREGSGECDKDRKGVGHEDRPDAWEGWWCSLSLIYYRLIANQWSIINILMSFSEFFEIKGKRVPVLLDNSILNIDGTNFVLTHSTSFKCLFDEHRNITSLMIFLPPYEMVLTHQNPTILSQW